MPIVNIIITREGTTPERPAVTPDEKAQLIAGASNLLLKVLSKPLNSTFVIIQEIEKESWGWDGLPVDNYRKARSAAAAPEPVAASGGPTGGVRD